MTDTIAIDFPRLSLDNGFFAYKYDPSGWTIYHKDNPRKAVWHTVEDADARRWARLPEYKAYAEAHGHKAAITSKGILEVYIQWSAVTPFGVQTGIETHQITNMKQLREILGY